MRTRSARPTPALAVRALALGALAVLCSLVLLAPHAGAAVSADTLVKEYQAKGKIDPCKHSATDLKAAKKKIGANLEQYSPDFADALDKAIANRGGCAKKSSGSSGGAGAAAGAVGGGGGSGGGGTATPAPGAPAPSTGGGPASPNTTKSAPKTPGPGPVPVAAPAAADRTILSAARPGPDATVGVGGATWAIIGGGLLLLALLAWALVNASDRIRWLTPLGHSMGEAGWRVSLRWAEFTDWLRLGAGR